ncbi:MAG: D-alanine--D-alanine ligase family protein [Candidatus Microsaccharimonas sp.]
MTSVLLLFGGASSEHDVSIASALNVAKSISAEKYAVTYAFIDKEGQWWKVDEVPGTVAEHTPKITPLFEESLFQIGNDTFRPDVIFPCLHGKDGEDGVVQDLAEKLNIPIVGCGVKASEAGINKILTKHIVQPLGIQTIPYQTHTAGDPIPSFIDLAATLSEKLFVKPVNAGSSIGAHKVSSQDELATAIEDAHLYDAEVMIETAVDPRELEVALLGNTPNVEASPVGEIVPDEEFYSYESKYSPDSTSGIITPANIPDELSDKIRQQALVVYNAIGGTGLSRADFFLDKTTGELYFNEINTMPGFTNISMYPKLWEITGISNEALMDKLITLALE